MKRLASLLVVCMMLLAMLAACGDTNTPSTGGGSDPGSGSSGSNGGGSGTTVPDDGELAPPDDSPVTLRVWMDNDDWAYAVIDAFEDLYPNVTIEYELVGNVDSRDKISNDGPAGIGADVFFVPHDHIGNLVHDGIIEPLPASLQQKYRGMLIEPAVETVTMDGDMYAVPISTENIALFYNKDLYGPNPPATFEEILEFARTYNNPAANQWTMTWQLDDSYHNFPWMSAAGLKIFGPNHDDFRNPGFDSPEVAKGLEYYLMMRETFDVPLSEGTWDNTVARFQRGEAPFTISGPWAIADARLNNVNFGVAKLPTIEGNQPWAFSGLIVANVSSYSTNQEWAHIFVDFLVSPKGASIMFEVTGKMTTMIDIHSIPGLADDEHLMGIAEQAPFTVPMPIIPEVQMMWPALGYLISSTWDGDLSIPAAQAGAMETYDTLLAAAGQSR